MIEHSQRTLRRELKPRHLQLIAIGGIIGSGYFLGTAEVLGKVGPAAVLAYALGGIIVVCVMLCLGELAVAHPVAGSFITYFRQLISPAWACGVGWSYWLTWAAYVPAEMIAAGIIMESFVPALDQFWWSLIFGGAVAAVNLNHVRAFGEIEFWLAIIKVVVILLFVVCAVAVLLGLIGSAPVGRQLIVSEGGFLPMGFSAVLVTMVLVLVNFQGAEIIGLAAAETDNPTRSIPVAIRNVTWRIIALYIVPLMLPGQHLSLA
jgi:AAT family amino acid transporter